MGTPDFCHFGNRCFQVKCFGKLSTSYVPGSEVQLFQKPEIATWMAYENAVRLQSMYRELLGSVDPLDDIVEALRDLDGLETFRDPTVAVGDIAHEHRVEGGHTRFLSTPWDDIVTDRWQRAHSGEPSPLTSYQIITRDSEYIVVFDRRLSHWQANPMPEMPIVANTGDVTTDPLQGAWPSESFLDEGNPCPVCEVLRRDSASQGPS